MSIGVFLYKEFGSLVKVYVKNQKTPNKNPKQLMNQMKKFRGSEIIFSKVSKDLSRLVLIQANLQMICYEFETNKSQKLTLPSRPNCITMIPDSLVMLACNTDGVRLYQLL